MTLVAVAFLIGTLICQQASVLPTGRWSLVLPVYAVIFLSHRPLRIPVALIIGYLWCLAHIHDALERGLPAEQEKIDVIVQGEVVGVPSVDDRRQRFEVDVFRWHGPLAHTLEKTRHLRLSWYDTEQRIEPGEHWEWRVRLKQPRGFRNPGSFDYEAWLLQQRIDATGYVREGRLLEASSASLGAQVDRWRWQIREKLIEESTAYRFPDLMAGLIIGDRSAMDDERWAVLNRTGTSHLLAISGLHIGLVGAVGWALGRRLWSAKHALTLWLPAQYVAALGAFGVAFVYAAMAGFAIPTQRALLMLGVAMVTLLASQRPNPRDALALALVAVVAWDPFAVMTSGFWLSFLAVAWIFYAAVGRIGPSKAWVHWLRMQWFITLGLAPILLMFFAQVSLVSPLANLVAIPWVSFLVVPLLLVGGVLLGGFPVLAHVLFSIADQSLGLLWWFLERLSSNALSFLVLAPPPWPIAAAGVVAIVWLLAPRGFPLKPLAVVCLIPMLLWRPPRPPQGELWLTLLDVGQGLSVVARTHHHALVYDVGPKFSDSFDAGAAVVAPYLHSIGVEKLDALVLGHGDNDHIGGARSLLDAIAVERLITRVSDYRRRADAQACEAGLSWVWDGVRFELLHPSSDEVRGSDNNQSCVLRIEAGGYAALLPGDIEKVGERQLIERYGDGLKAAVLIAPHHGSNTSSTNAFVDKVAPDIVLFPVGAANRFGFPHPEVVARYAGHRVRFFDSASHGAITVRLAPSGLQIQPYKSAARSRYYWRWNAVSRGEAGLF